jgi:hypothetical protein
MGMATKSKRAPAHKWEFKPRFRRHAFGWRSQPAIARVNQAVSEIKKVAKKDPALAAEGAVLFIERISPAIEQVDSSSGAIGAAVHNAIADLAAIISAAPTDEGTRDSWLERLWAAQQEDDIPYLESLGHRWGTLCGSKEVASSWADRLIGIVKMAWSPDPNLRGFFKGTSNCLSALVAAARHDDVLALLELAPYKMWHDRQYGMMALAAQGKGEEAIRYAEEGRGLNDSPTAIASACEAVLLSLGRTEEAYRRYGLLANQRATHLATFKAVARKYPHKNAADILADLVATTPGDEGKWFAAAKDAGLLEEALALASRMPCDPKTLTRAARDFLDDDPAFAVGAGVQALQWLIAGYGYDVTGADVWAAYDATMKAADRRGEAAPVKERIRRMVGAERGDAGFVARLLERELG